MVRAAFATPFFLESSFLRPAVLVFDFFRQRLPEPSKIDFPDHPARVLSILGLIAMTKSFLEIRILQRDAFFISLKRLF